MESKAQSDVGQGIGGGRLSRRSLLSWLLGGSVAAFIGTVLYNLGRFIHPPQELIGNGGGGKQTVIPLAELAAEHSKVVRHDGKLVIVVRQAGNEVHALAAACTHLGCIVHWKDKGDAGMKMGDSLHCACHDAFFDLKTGKVLGGPAPRPLQTYPVKITQDQIVIGEA